MPPHEFDRLRVVLVNTRNPLNIGAAARAMSNFGFRHLRVVNPYQAAFRDAKSAVGAADLLARAQQFTSVAEAVADCTLVVGTTAVRHRELKHPLQRLELGARLIRKRLASSSVALLFGSEKFGLGNQHLSHCDWLMRIPTCEQNISMNLGQAVALCLYELARNPKALPAPEKRSPASARDAELLTSILVDVLHTSGYMHSRPPDFVEEKARRLIRRLRLEAHDAEILMGMVRQISWKLSTKRG